MMKKNPLPTVDVIIEVGEKIVLINRKNPPLGWALPGGFVDLGETVEQAARREVKEETGLELTDLMQFRVYSDPSRDPRQHTITTVFSARGLGQAHGADDALQADLFAFDQLPEPLAFDHAQIIKDYLGWQSGQKGLAERKTSIQGQLLHKKSFAKKYRDIFIGRRGWWRFLQYEAVTVCCGSLGGALGLALRKIFFKKLFRRVGQGVVFGRHMTIRHPHKIEIGDNVFFDDYVVLDAKGENNRGIIVGSNCFIGRNTVLSCKEGEIVLKDFVSISNNCSLLSESRIHIGNCSFIAGHCFLVAGGNHGYENTDIPMIFQVSQEKGGVVLEGDNWLGAGVQVLDGTVIGYGSIIGAGSTVYKDVANYSIAVGVPALVTKRRK